MDKGFVAQLNSMARGNGGQEKIVGSSGDTQLNSVDDQCPWGLDDLGRLQTVTSYDASDTVVNEVEVTFDACGNVAESVQDHSGIVVVGENLPRTHKRRSMCKG